MKKLPPLPTPEDMRDDNRWPEVVRQAEAAVFRTKYPTWDESNPHNVVVPYALHKAAIAALKERCWLAEGALTQSVDAEERAKQRAIEAEAEVERLKWMLASVEMERQRYGYCALKPADLAARWEEEHP